MEDGGHKMSRKERIVWYKEATYRKRLEFRGAYGRAPMRVCLSGKSLPHTQRKFLACKGWH